MLSSMLSETVPRFHDPVAHVTLHPAGLQVFGLYVVEDVGLVGRGPVAEGADPAQMGVPHHVPQDKCVQV